MLGKNRNEKKEEVKGKVETILGSGTVVEGDIHTKGSIRIEGEVKGNIKAEGDLHVGEEGIVKTEIEARNVVIAGTVKGNVIARNRIEILPSGKLEGDIATDILKIEEGALFNGTSKPLKDNKKVEESKKARSEAASTKKKS